MAIVTIVSVLAFGATLCFSGIPKMLESRSYKEMWLFSVLLALGVILSVLKCLKVSIPNPSDWLAWMCAPASDYLKNILE